MGSLVFTMTKETEIITESHLITSLANKYTREDKTSKWSSSPDGIRKFYEREIRYTKRHVTCS